MRPDAGLPDVVFAYQKYQLRYSSEGLGIEYAGKFFGHLVHCRRFLPKLCTASFFQKFSRKIGKNRRKLAKIGKNRRKLAKIGKNRRKFAKIAALAKIAENSDNNVEPRSDFAADSFSFLCKPRRQCDKSEIRQN
jgi:hypothetical protein